MDKYFRIVLILCFLCTSCVTQKKCFDRYGSIRDTVYNTYRDTIYFVTVTSDTVYASGILTDTVNASTALASGRAWIKRDTLFLKVWQKDTIIEYRDSIQIVNHEIVQTIQAPPKFNGVLWQVLGIVFLILLIILFVRFRK